MTYQGERARPLASEVGRVLEVSRVRLDAQGHVSDVLWGEVDATTDHDVGEQVRGTAAEVVDALHDGASVVAVFATAGESRHLPRRSFVVVDQQDGVERIELADGPAPGREVTDMARLD